MQFFLSRVRVDKQRDEIKWKYCDGSGIRDKNLFPQGAEILFLFYTQRFCLPSFVCVSVFRGFERNPGQILTMGNNGWIYYIFVD